MKKFFMSGYCVARLSIILSQELRIGGTYNCAILCNMATMVRFCQVNECPIREHIILHCKQYQMIVNAVWYQLTRGAVELWKCHHSSGLELLKEIRDSKNFYGIAYIITVVTGVNKLAFKWIIIWEKFPQNGLWGRVSSCWRRVTKLFPRKNYHPPKADGKISSQGRVSLP